MHWSSLFRHMKCLHAWIRNALARPRRSARCRCRRGACARTWGTRACWSSPRPCSTATTPTTPISLFYRQQKKKTFSIRLKLFNDTINYSFTNFSIVRRKLILGGALPWITKTKHAGCLTLFVSIASGLQYLLTWLRNEGLFFTSKILI